MSLLNKKCQTNLRSGVHKVKLTSYGEYEGQERTLEDGSVIKTKPYLWWRMETMDGKQYVTHKFYSVEDDPSGQRTLEILTNILTPLQLQTNIVADEWGDFFQALVDTKQEFTTSIVEVPSEDGTRMYTNFNYDAKLATLRNALK